MREKRFECVFKEHETKNSWSMIKDNQLDKPLYIKDVVDLLNEQQSTISRLEKENEQLKQEHKIAIDEMITDYKNLEKEIKRLECLNNQLERRLDYDIAYDMEECE